MTSTKTTDVSSSTVEATAGKISDKNIVKLHDCILKIF